MADGRESQVEFGTFANCALHNDTSAHFLYYRLANAQSQTTTRGVQLLVFGEGTEVYEKTTEFVFRNTTTEVLHLQKKLYVATGLRRAFRTLFARSLFALI